MQVREEVVSIPSFLRSIRLACPQIIPDPFFVSIRTSLFNCRGNLKYGGSSCEVYHAILDVIHVGEHGSRNNAPEVRTGRFQLPENTSNCHVRTLAAGDEIYSRRENTAPSSTSPGWRLPHTLPLVISSRINAEMDLNQVDGVGAFQPGITGKFLRRFASSEESFFSRRKICRGKWRRKFRATHRGIVLEEDSDARHPLLPICDPSGHVHASPRQNLGIREPLFFSLQEPASVQSTRSLSSTPLSKRCDPCTIYPSLDTADDGQVLVEGQQIGTPRAIP